MAHNQFEIQFDPIKQKIAYIILLDIALVIIGAVFYTTVEGWNWIDASYFSISTLTTVGFGDLHPTHSISRIFSSFYMLIGIPVMFYSITLLGVYSIEKGIYRKLFHMAPSIERYKQKPKTKQLAREIEELNKKLARKMKELEEAAKLE